jgi:hypothetical protein
MKAFGMIAAGGNSRICSMPDAIGEVLRKKSLKLVMVFRANKSGVEECLCLREILGAMVSIGSLRLLPEGACCEDAQWAVGGELFDQVTMTKVMRKLPMLAECLQGKMLVRKNRLLWKGHGM